MSGNRIDHDMALAGPLRDVLVAAQVTARTASPASWDRLDTAVRALVAWCRTPPPAPPTDDQPALFDA